MALTPKDYAAAFYRAVRDLGGKEVTAAAKRLREALARRGQIRLLPRVLAALPAAMRAVDADRRVTVESAHELDDATLRAVLKAVGTDKDAQIETRIRPELLGGALIRTKDGTIDASARGKLMKIKDALARAA